MQLRAGRLQRPACVAVYRRQASPFTGDERRCEAAACWSPSATRSVRVPATSVSPFTGDERRCDAAACWSPSATRSVAVCRRRACVAVHRRRASVRGSCVLVAFSDQRASPCAGDERASPFTDDERRCEVAACWSPSATSERRRVPAARRRSPTTSVGAR